MALADEINRADPKIQKKVYIKRRLRNPSTTNYFESDWLDVTEYLITNGISNISSNIDSVSLNAFTQGGFSLKMRNDDYQFADETKTNSLFNGYLTNIIVNNGYHNLSEKPCVGGSIPPGATIFAVLSKRKAN